MNFSLVHFILHSFLLVITESVNFNLKDKQLNKDLDVHKCDVCTCSSLESSFSFVAFFLCLHTFYGIVQFQKKNPYPPHGRSSEIPRGRGVLKVKNLEAKNETKLNFLGGAGVQNKRPSVGGVWIFSGTVQFHHY